MDKTPNSSYNRMQDLNVSLEENEELDYGQRKRP